MVPTGDNNVTEIMAFGICWRSSYHWNGEKVLLKHKGYAFHLFGLFIPLPITWLLGAGNAWETPTSDTGFNMYVEIRHPLWGKLYGYDGHFELDQSK